MNKYEIILSVCETHSISKTASKLNYTQSAISQAIKGFEKELGITLFRRSKLGMDLMPNTEEIIESIKIICKEERKMKIHSLPANIANLDSGNIRIGTIQSISYHWLPDILKQFSEDYPNICFEFTVDGFSTLKEKILSNQLDCIFVSQYSVPNLPFIPLDKDALMLVTPIGHPLSEQISVSFSDIKRKLFACLQMDLMSTGRYSN